MEGLTGVYHTKATIGAKKDTDTIGIPELAKQNLINYPTYRSPGIIQGAAVDYEVRKGPTDYEPIPGKELVAPYEYFRYTITEVETKDADGNITKHLKPSGFDGTYYIVRLDVSDIVNNKQGYLHVKTADNKAFMVLFGTLDGAVGVHIADAVLVAHLVVLCRVFDAANAEQRHIAGLFGRERQYAVFVFQQGEALGFYFGGNLACLC